MYFSLRFERWGWFLFAPVSLLATALAQAPVPPPPVVTLRIDPKPMMAISPAIYGVNHDWNKVPAEMAPLTTQTGADNVLTFTLNPGTAGRGKGWEIARISLQ